MGALWTIPAVVGVVGLLALHLLARQVADELTHLGASARRAHDLRVAVVRVRTEIDDLRATVEAIRHR